MAMITTSLLLVVSFMVVNIAFKQLIISNTNEESQYAFYAADSGAECAVYWDLHDPLISKFATTTAGTISCSGVSVSTGNQTVPTIPTQPSVIGGAAVSIFKVDYPKGCAIVRVTKSYSGSTLRTVIDSRGYNTCSATALRRFERGITLSY